jgi:YegS/Rv2252/BmrU family lipid kinase
VSPASRAGPAPTLVILNPAAGHRRAAGRWARARAALGAAGRDLVVWSTTRPGEGAALARRALAAGYRRLLAVGGDGTLSEVVDGFLTESEVLRADAAVGTWPVGSGCDFARGLGLRADPRQLATLLTQPLIRRLDTGRVTWRDAHGRSCSRHFVNIAAFGLAGEVGQTMQRRGAPLGGRLSYLVEALRAIVRARARSITLVVDGTPEPAIPYLLGVVSNTPVFGGGMRIAPSADPADGVLDLMTLDECSRPALLRLLSRVYGGTHVGRPGVSLRPVRRLEVTGAEPLPLNVDGDLCGAMPVTIEVRPASLPFLLDPGTAR